MLIIPNQFKDRMLCCPYVKGGADIDIVKHTQKISLSIILYIYIYVYTYIYIHIHTHAHTRSGMIVCSYSAIMSDVWFILIVCNLCRIRSIHLSYPSFSFLSNAHMHIKQSILFYFPLELGASCNKARIRKLVNTQRKDCGQCA